jgi:hypothetical protein
VIAFAFAGWMLAAVFVGLYVGERGRRRDAQRREGVLPVDPVKRATVRLPESSVPATVSTATADAKARYIADAVAEGYSEAEAEADWTEMMHTANSDLPLGVTA